MCYAMHCILTAVSRSSAFLQNLHLIEGHWWLLEHRPENSSWFLENMEDFRQRWAKWIVRITIPSLECSVLFFNCWTWLGVTAWHSGVGQGGGQGIELVHYVTLNHGEVLACIWLNSNDVWWLETLDGTKPLCTLTSSCVALNEFFFFKQWL